MACPSQASRPEQQADPPTSTSHPRKHTASHTCAPLQLLPLLHHIWHQAVGLALAPCVTAQAASCRQVGVDLLAHTLDLDLRFHLHRKTGEVTRILDRGGNALQNILSTVLFNIGTPCSALPYLPVHGCLREASL